MIQLSIVIVSYNTKEILRNCINSIYENAGNLNFELLVVDNNSSDGSSEMVEKEFEKVILIKNEENLGFSKANNIGVKKTNGKYVLFLNSDTLMGENTLSHMVSFMDKHKKAGAATCMVNLKNGKLDDASHRGFPTPWNSFSHFSGLSKIFGKTKLFGGYNLGYMDLNNVHQVDSLAGAFMIVRREAGEEVGWWDEDYFFYGEDLDFCYELKKKGWEIYFVPEVSIVHLKGVSGGIKDISKDLSKADDTTKKKAREERFKAMEIFYKKHYMDKYPRFITTLVFMGINLKKSIS
jgi:GT2 family glycosyltransferase